MKRGPFEVTGSKQIYKNPWIEVREDQVIRPSGEKGAFGIVETLPGSAILVLTKDNEVYLVKEFHYAQGLETYELPGGASDPGEDPLETAKRELKEETGIVAKKWTDLGFVNPLTVVLKSPNYMFLAEELEMHEVEDPEADLIKLEKVPLKKALQLVLEGEITHSASVAAILKVARMKGL